MIYPDKHLYLMHSNEPWVTTFSLSASKHLVLNTGKYSRKFGISALHKHIEEIVKENKISLLFLELSTNIIDPFVLEELKSKYKLTLVLFQLDDEFKFETISATYATIADLVLTLDYVSIDRYRQSGINAHLFMHSIYMPDQKILDEKEGGNYEVCFLGRLADKPSRKEMIDFLVEKGVEIKVIDTSGENFLERDHMYSIFKNSKINLSFSGITDYINSENPLQAKKRGVKARHLEIAAAGGFCLAEYSIVAAEHLREDKEISFFYSKEELLNKINFYLDRDNERKEIASNAKKAIDKRYSPLSVSFLLKDLIKSAIKYKGKDLYGEDLELSCSKSFAVSYINFSFPYSVRLLLRGKFRIFFKDFSQFCRFLKNFIRRKSLLQGIGVFIISLYRLIKFYISPIYRKFKSKK